MERSRARRRAATLVAAVASQVGLVGVGLVAVGASASPAGAAEPGPVLTAVSPGYNSCGLTGDGAAYCWGDDSSGQLGNGPGVPAEQRVPSLVLTPAGVSWADVSTGARHTCGVTGAGVAYCWGANDEGRLGIGVNGGSRDTPTPVAAPAGVTWESVRAGRVLSCGLTTDHLLYCWGWLTGSPAFVNTPLSQSGGPWANVSVGDAAICAVTTAGEGYCWGDEGGRQLFGDGGGPEQSPTPQPVTTPAGVVWSKIIVRTQAACGLTTSGALYCWGVGSNLGNGSSSSAVQATPSPVVTPAGVIWKDVDVFGSGGGCALTTAGAVYCWGSNSSGQLGNGVFGGRSDSPVRVPSLAGVVATDVSTGVSTAFAMTADGPVGWGSNDHGQLGNGSPTGSSTATALGTPQTITFEPLDSLPAGTSVDLEATATSGRTVTYRSTGPCTVAGSTLTTTGAGQCEVRAAQAGGGGWAAAAPVTRSFTVTFADADGDEVGDASDNCASTPNADQADLDGDDVGDACDPDTDGDGVLNADDAFPTNPGESVDTDHDGVGDNTDLDDDGDGISDTEDAFPTDGGESLDSDHDGIGDHADTDDDGDGIPDAEDAFPLEKDGALSGGVSRQIQANPALAPVLTPVRTVFLFFGV